MKTLKRSFLMLSALFAIVSPGSAQASEQTLHAFFTALEGNWSGSGANRQLPADGRRIETPYTLEVRVRTLGFDRWEVQNIKRTSTGWNERTAVQFRVRGDQLFVGAVNPNERVELTDTTERSLGYRIYRTDPRTGAVLRYTYESRLVDAPPTRRGEPGPTFLEGLNTLEQNGVTISEDQFALEP